MIDIDPPDEASRRLGHAVGDLAELVPTDWALVGGLMVQLHALEQHVPDVRATVDIDVLGQARPPGPLQAIDRALIDTGFRAHPPDPDNYGYRHEREGLIVDVLAPDGIRTQSASRAARKRSRGQKWSPCRSTGRTFELRRPTLTGAILIKARSPLKHRDPGAQRQDLFRLLSLVPDPRTMRADLKTTERRWLRRVGAHLRLDERDAVDDELLHRTELAYIYGPFVGQKLTKPEPRSKWRPIFARVEEQHPPAARGEFEDPAEIRCGLADVARHERVAIASAAELVPQPVGPRSRSRTRRRRGLPAASRRSQLRTPGHGRRGSAERASETIRSSRRRCGSRTSASGRRPSRSDGGSGIASAVVPNAGRSPLARILRRREVLHRLFLLDDAHSLHAEGRARRHR